MCNDQSQNAEQLSSKPNTDPASPNFQQMSDVERSILATHLILINQRLSEIDASLSSKLAKRETAPNTFLELAKIILGSWPSFGLLLMLLFYIPLRDAINTIPGKVKSASEIGVLGGSVKNPVQAEAQKAGLS